MSDEQIITLSERKTGEVQTALATLPYSPELQAHLLTCTNGCGQEITEHGMPLGFRWCEEGRRLRAYADIAQHYVPTTQGMQFLSDEERDALFERLRQEAQGGERMDG